jgi:crossover junction endodeoxyribonuclease RuvC
MNLILGIDPGITGALAWYDIETGKLENVVDMPTLSVKHRTKKNKKVLDVYSLGLLIDSRAMKTEACALEKVSAAPHQGVSSTFNFGYVAGQTNGLVAGANIPIIMVYPTVWKTYFGLTGRDKKQSLELANEFFPNKHKWFKKVKDHNRAEAALIAYFCAKTIRNNERS